MVLGTRQTVLTYPGSQGTERVTRHMGLEIRTVSIRDSTSSNGLHPASDGLLLASY